LRELNFGVREALPRSYTRDQAIIEVAKMMNIDVSDVVDTAESLEGVYIRQVAFLTSLGHQLNNIDHSSISSDKMESSIGIDRMTNIIPIDGLITKVLCVAHGGYIKNFLRNFCKNIIVPDKIQNCAVSIITIDWPDRFDPTVFTCITSDDLVNINYYDNQL
jgi:broad specificity phosphatase PhoE